MIALLLSGLGCDGFDSEDSIESDEFGTRSDSRATCDYSNWLVSTPSCQSAEDGNFIYTASALVSGNDGSCDISAACSDWANSFGPAAIGRYSSDSQVCFAATVNRYDDSSCTQVLNACDPADFLVGEVSCVASENGTFVYSAGALVSTSGDCDPHGGCTLWANSYGVAVSESFDPVLSVCNAESVQHYADSNCQNPAVVCDPTSFFFESPSCQQEPDGSFVYKSEIFIEERPGCNPDTICADAAQAIFADIEIDFSDVTPGSCKLKTVERYSIATVRLLSKSTLARIIARFLQ